MPTSHDPRLRKEDLMTVTTSSARHLLFRLSEPSRLPESLLGPLRDEVVLAGWMRASGILHDVRIRGGAGTSTLTLRGAVRAIVLEGSIGLSEGDVTCGLRAVLSRDTDTGVETIAGEIVEARIGALEVMVTAFDEVTVTRDVDPTAVWIMGPSSAEKPAQPARAEIAASTVTTSVAQPAPPAPSPSEPTLPKPSAPKPSPTFSGSAMPVRPAKPHVVEEEQICPDAGDVVEHFAFGRCEVVKSDGDRLHLRLGKDGRVKEIALEMLKVTPLPPVEGGANKHFKLDRKL